MADLVPIVKNFYNESQTVAQRSDQETHAYYQSKQITVKGPNVAKPVYTFEEAGFPGALDKIFQLN